MEVEVERSMMGPWREKEKGRFENWRWFFDSERENKKEYDIFITEREGLGGGFVKCGVVCVLCVMEIGIKGKGYYILAIRILGGILVFKI